MCLLRGESLLGTGYAERMKGRKSKRSTSGAASAGRQARRQNAQRQSRLGVWLLLQLVGLVLITGALLLMWAGRGDEASPDGAEGDASPGSSSGTPAAAGDRALLPVDPRVAYTGPLRNVRPEVQYVGDAKCTECHEEIGQAYRQHPMGRSLATVAAAEAIEQFGARHFNPFVHDRLIYGVRREGDRAWHWVRQEDEQGEVITRLEVEVQMAVGSGSHARSYLFQREGHWFYSPITWYSQPERWGLSPAFRTVNQRFAHAIDRGCFFCHMNQVEPVSAAINAVRLEGRPIGCERCHGPGELHVARQTAEAPAGPDVTIVHPGRLVPALRDAVCEQCHLQGVARVPRRGRDPFEYRPGLPLHQFVACFVEPAGSGDTTFVGHAEQMRLSRCFQRSGGKLGCTSCHDPHRQPTADERVEFYRGRCWSCHKEGDCTQPRERRLQQSPADDCTQCHMPRREPTNVTHVSVSDHRIGRTPATGPAGQDATPQPGNGKAAATPSSPPLLENFHARLPDAADADAARDLGIALAELAVRSDTARRAAALAEARPLLRAAVARDPTDAAAWEAYGQVLWGENEPAEAQAAFTSGLAHQPRRESLLAYAGALALATRDFKRARELWTRAVEVNPQHARYLHGLGDAQQGLGDWAGAAEAYRRVLELDPQLVLVRLQLAQALALQGERSAAAAEYRQVLRVDGESLAARLGLGDVLLAAQQWRAAAEEYRRALAIQPDLPQVRLRLAECYRQLGEKEKAAEVLRGR